MSRLVSRIVRVLAAAVLLVAWLVALALVLRFTCIDWPSSWNPSGDATTEFALTMLRVVVAAAAMWLLVATTLDTARITHRALFHRGQPVVYSDLDHTTSAMLPRLLRRVLVVSLVAGVVGASPARAEGDDGPAVESTRTQETATLFWAADESLPITTTSSVPETAAGRPPLQSPLDGQGTLHRPSPTPTTVPSVQVASDTADTPPRAGAISGTPRPALRYQNQPSSEPDRNAAPAESVSAAPETPTESGTEWTVRLGEHFWSIAEQALAADGRDSRSEHDVARYWMRLIEANLDQLVRPGDPNLLIPGQRLVLPAR